MIKPTGAIAAFAFLLAVGSGHAETMKVSADLKGSAETPPNTAKGTGSLSGTYDTVTRKLSYEVSYADLTGPATMAHFHAPAPVGKSSGVEIPIKGALASPIKGEKTLDAKEAKNLTDGLTYFNIHTAANKNGEIRGQVTLEK